MLAGRTVVTRAHCLGGVVAGKTSPATTREERGMGRGCSGGGSLTMLGCTSTHLESTAYSQCRCRREPWVGERRPSPPPLRAGRLATALLARVPRLQLCRGGGGNDHVKLNHRISASTNLRKALGEVRESHLDFGPRDAATACHSTGSPSTWAGGKRSKATKTRPQFSWRFKRRNTRRVSWNLRLSNTLWAVAKLAREGMEVDVAAFGG